MPFSPLAGHLYNWSCGNQQCFACAKAQCGNNGAKDPVTPASSLNTLQAPLCIEGTVATKSYMVELLNSDGTISTTTYPIFTGSDADFMNHKGVTTSSAGLRYRYKGWTWDCNQSGKCTGGNTPTSCWVPMAEKCGDGILEGTEQTESQAECADGTYFDSTSCTCEECVTDSNCDILNVTRAKCSGNSLQSNTYKCTNKKCVATPVSIDCTKDNLYAQCVGGTPYSQKSFDHLCKCGFKPNTAKPNTVSACLCGDTPAKCVKGQCGAKCSDNEVSYEYRDLGTPGTCGYQKDAYKFTLKCDPKCNLDNQNDGGRCGDNQVQAAEECDDGSVCANGRDCSADPNICTDGSCHKNSGYGCDANCMLECGKGDNQNDPRKDTVFQVEEWKKRWNELGFLCGSTNDEPVSMTINWVSDKGETKISTFPSGSSTFTEWMTAFIGSHSHITGINWSCSKHNCYQCGTTFPGCNANVNGKHSFMDYTSVNPSGWDWTPFQAKFKAACNLIPGTNNTKANCTGLCNPSSMSAEVTFKGGAGVATPGWTWTCGQESCNALQAGCPTDTAYKEGPHAYNTFSEYAINESPLLCLNGGTPVFAPVYNPRFTDSNHLINYGINGLKQPEGGWLWRCKYPGEGDSELAPDLYAPDQQNDYFTGIWKANGLSSIGISDNLYCSAFETGECTDLTGRIQPSDLKDKLANVQGHPGLCSHGTVYISQNPGDPNGNPDLKFKDGFACTSDPKTGDRKCYWYCNNGFYDSGVNTRFAYNSNNPELPPCVTAVEGCRMPPSGKTDFDMKNDAKTGFSDLFGNCFNNGQWRPVKHYTDNTCFQKFCTSGIANVELTAFSYNKSADGVSWTWKCGSEACEAKSSCQMADLTTLKLSGITTIPVPPRTATCEGNKVKYSVNNTGSCQNVAYFWTGEQFGGTNDGLNPDDLKASSIILSAGQQAKYDQIAVTAVCNDKCADMASDVALQTHKTFEVLHPSAAGTLFIGDKKEICTAEKGTITADVKDCANPEITWEHMRVIPNPDDQIGGTITFPDWTDKKFVDNALTNDLIATASDKVLNIKETDAGDWYYRAVVKCPDCIDELNPKYQLDLLGGNVPQAGTSTSNIFHVKINQTYALDPHFWADAAKTKTSLTICKNDKDYPQLTVEEHKCISTETDTFDIYRSNSAEPKVSGTLDKGLKSLNYFEHFFSAGSSTLGASTFHATVTCSDVCVQAPNPAPTNEVTITAKDPMISLTNDCGSTCTNQHSTIKAQISDCSDPSAITWQYCSNPLSGCNELSSWQAIDANISEVYDPNLQKGYIEGDLGGGTYRASFKCSDCVDKTKVLSATAEIKRTELAAKLEFTGEERDKCTENELNFKASYTAAPGACTNATITWHASRNVDGLWEEVPEVVSKLNPELLPSNGLKEAYRKIIIPTGNAMDWKFWYTINCDECCNKADYAGAASNEVGMTLKEKGKLGISFADAPNLDPKNTICEKDTGVHKELNAITETPIAPYDFSVGANGLVCSAVNVGWSLQRESDGTSTSPIVNYDSEQLTSDHSRGLGNLWASAHNNTNSYTLPCSGTSENYTLGVKAACSDNNCLLASDWIYRTINVICTKSSKAQPKLDTAGTGYCTKVNPKNIKVEGDNCTDSPSFTWRLQKEANSGVFNDETLVGTVATDGTLTLPDSLAPGHYRAHFVEKCQEQCFDDTTSDWVEFDIIASHAPELSLSSNSMSLCDDQKKGVKITVSDAKHYQCRQGGKLVDPTITWELASSSDNYTYRATGVTVADYALDGLAVGSYKLKASYSCANDPCFTPTSVTSSVITIKPLTQATLAPETTNDYTICSDKLADQNLGFTYALDSNICHRIEIGRNLYSNTAAKCAGTSLGSKAEDSGNSSVGYASYLSSQPLTWVHNPITAGNYYLGINGNCVDDRDYYTSNEDYCIRGPQDLCQPVKVLASVNPDGIVTSTKANYCEGDADWKFEYKNDTTVCDGTPTYAWKLFKQDGTEVTGLNLDNAATVNLKGKVAPDKNTIYHLQLTLSCTDACYNTKTFESGNFQLLPMPATPTVITSPDDQLNKCADKPFDLIGDGSCGDAGDTLSYQWQSADAADGPWTDIIGATSNTYRSPMAAGYYQLKLTCANTCGKNSIPTNAAHVTILPPPATPDAPHTPNALSFCFATSTDQILNTNATNCNIDGKIGTPHYQWQKNVGSGWSDIGSDSNNYSLSSAEKEAKASYRVGTYCQNNCGISTTTFSGAVDSTVYPLAVKPTNIKAPTNQDNKCSKMEYSLVSGGTCADTDNTSYQWQYLMDSANPDLVTSWEDVTGEKAATYNKPSPAGTYRLQITCTSKQGCGSEVGYSPTSTVSLIDPLPTPTVSISSSIDNICPDKSVTFTATPGNCTASTYQWYKGTTAITGATGATYTDSSLKNNDAIKVVMTCADICVETDKATSNILTMTVKALPKATIDANDGNPVDQKDVCSGTGYTLTGAGSCTGTDTKTYQWQKQNGTAWDNFIVSSDNSDKTGTITNAPGGDYRLAVTCTNTCGSDTTSTRSANVSILGNPDAPTTVSVAPNTLSYCAQSTGHSLAATASACNKQGSPRYQWYIDGTIIATNGSSSSLALTENNSGTYSYRADVLCHNKCGDSAVTASDPVATVTVDPLLTPTVAITATATGICSGVSVTFTATSTECSSPTYQWYKNDTTVANNNPDPAKYTTNALVDGDNVKAVMTCADACVTARTATSNVITESVDTPAEATVTRDPISLSAQCTNVNYSLSGEGSCTGTNVERKYQWQKNGSDYSDISSGSDTNTLANPSSGSYQLVITCKNSCKTSLATTTAATVTTLALPSTPSIEVRPNSLSYCAGTTGQRLTASTVACDNSGTAHYQWYKDSVSQNHTSTTLALNDDSAGDYYATALCRNSCGDSGVASSSSATVAVNQPKTPTITIAADANNICPGEPVTFTATHTDCSQPSYSWYKLDQTDRSFKVITGASGATYTVSSLVNNDAIKSVMTCKDDCITTETATSNIVTTTVKIAASVSAATVSTNPLSLNNICATSDYSMTGNGGICSGTAVTTVHQWEKQQSDDSWSGTGQPSATTTYTNAPSGTYHLKTTCSDTCNNTVSTSTPSVPVAVINLPDAPIITTPPVSQDFCASEPVRRLGVEATCNNFGNPLYQWRSRTNTLGTDQFQDLNNIAGTYWVEIACFNTCGTGAATSSDPVDVKVHPDPTAPTITANPASQVQKCQGDSFNISGEGDCGNITEFDKSYQWQSEANGRLTNVLGQTTNTYHNPGSGTYRLQVSCASKRGCGAKQSADTDAAVVTVTDIAPQNANSLSAAVSPVCTTSTTGTTLTATSNSTCSGTKVFTLQKNDYGSWSDIGTSTATTTATFSTGQLSRDTSYRFKVKCEDNGCSKESDYSATTTVTVAECTCGPANTKSYTDANQIFSGRVDNRCNSRGTASVITTGTGKMTWTCTYGNIVSSCSANIVACGSLNGNYYTGSNWNGKSIATANSSATGNLCKYGTAVPTTGSTALSNMSAVEKSSTAYSDGNISYYSLDTGWKWRCKGDGDSSDILAGNCTANTVACGIADGQTTLDHSTTAIPRPIQPHTSSTYYASFTDTTWGSWVAGTPARACVNNVGSLNLSASAVNDRGLYSWSCTDSESNTVSCQARKDCGWACNGSGTTCPSSDTSRNYGTIDFRVAGNSATTNLGCWTADNVMHKSNDTKDMYFDQAVAFNGNWDTSTTSVKYKHADLRLSSDMTGQCPSSATAGFVVPRTTAWNNLEKYLSANNSNCTNTRLNYATSTSAACNGAGSAADGLADPIGFHALSADTGYWTMTTDYGAANTQLCGTSRAATNCGQKTIPVGTTFCNRSPFYFKVSFNSSSQTEKLSDTYQTPASNTTYFCGNGGGSHNGEYTHQLRCIMTGSFSSAGSGSAPRGLRI